MEEEVRMMTMMMDGLDDSNDFVNFFHDGRLFFFLFFGGRFLALRLGMAWTGSGFGLGRPVDRIFVFPSSSS